jgi:hypothetical protein
MYVCFLPSRKYVEQPHLASSSPISTFPHVDFNVRVFRSDIGACTCTLVVRTITVGTIVVGVICVGTITVGIIVIGVIGVGAIGVGASVLRPRLSVIALVTPNISMYHIKLFENLRKPEGS